VATPLLVVPATEENDWRLAENRSCFDRVFRLQARTLQALVDGGAVPVARGDRGVAMFDPSSRRRAWLLASWIDGRRTPLRYRDRAAFPVGPPGGKLRRRPMIHG
jgi:hypothetical protein